MRTIGLLAEGVTDQIVLEAILRGVFGDDIDVNYVQPPGDATSEGGGHPPAGWTVLFRALREGRHLEALQFNDLVVVQVDSDVCDHPGFDVPKHDAANSRTRTVEELVEAVTERIEDEMGREVCGANPGRLVVAVAVHQTECWLLPLVAFRPKEMAKVQGCLEAANQALRRRKLPLLSSGPSKNPKAYQSVANAYRKSKVLQKAAEHSASLGVLLVRLERLRDG